MHDEEIEQDNAEEARYQDRVDAEIDEAKEEALNDTLTPKEDLI